MEQHTRSQRIARVSWGQLVVEGYPIFKDAKLFPGGARMWLMLTARTSLVPDHLAIVNHHTDLGKRVYVVQRVAVHD